MKISKILFCTSIVALGFSSCMSEEFPYSDSRKGSMSLAVEHLKPTVTRAIETSDFPVAIYEVETDAWYETFEKASEVPSQITMPVGMYYVKAHTPGQMTKIMDAPYYAGVDTFEIVEGIITKSTVVCRQANGSFSVGFSDDFAQSFSEWTISITDGSESAIIFSSEDGTNQPTIYMEFAKNVSSLTTRFTGTTVDGNRVSATNVLTKKQASEKYDSDTEFFSGGDAIVLNLRPVESTEGTISGITISANISFEETNDSFDMEVEDVIPDEEEQPEQPGDGGESDDSNAITLSLPKDMIIDDTTESSLGDALIECQEGIKSIVVKIQGSEAMMGALADLSSNYKGVDFVNGTNIVENQELVRLFTDLGQTLKVPAVGDVEYTFPIGNFFAFLAVLPGKHKFDMVVTDIKNNTKSGSLTLTVE